MSVPSIVCTLCGTEQPNAWDCAACGHPLHQRPPLEVEVASLEELDTGRAADPGNVATSAMLELEATSLPEAPALPSEAMLELETTAVSGPVQVQAEAVPDIEPTALAAGEPATAAATGAATCRYCGTPWQPGSSIFCARCGMRIPATQGQARNEAASDVTSCPGCGTPGQTVGARCSSCGQKVIAFA